MQQIAVVLPTPMLNRTDGVMVISHHGVSGHMIHHMARPMVHHMMCDLL